MTEISSPTHYEILGLPFPPDEPSLTAHALRGAYRRALLRCHPDKAQTLSADGIPQPINETRRVTNGTGKQKEAYSIDQISKAYAVLSNAKERKVYDEELRRERVLNGGAGVGGEKKFKMGVEVVDLDDLVYDERKGIWYRGCRCGDESGFEVREQDLEEGEGDGEVVVGCRGCSLWLRVLFGVVEEVFDAVT